MKNLTGGSVFLGSTRWTWTLNAPGVGQQYSRRIAEIDSDGVVTIAEGVTAEDIVRNVAHITSRGASPAAYERQKLENRFVAESHLVAMLTDLAEKALVSAKETKSLALVTEIVALLGCAAEKMNATGKIVMGDPSDPPGTVYMHPDARAGR